MLDKDTMTSEKKYIVTIPITGAVAIEVFAADSKAAQDAAWKQIDSGEFKPDDDNLTWEYTEDVVTGNVCHAFQSHVEVSEVRE